MRLRFLLMAAVLAGCASPSPPTPAAAPTAVTPEPRVAEPAPSAAAPILPPTASGDLIFDAWAADFRTRALAGGIAPEVFAREMTGLTPDLRVAALEIGRAHV